MKGRWRGPGTFGNSRDLSPRFWRDQDARWRVSGFSRDQNITRSAKAFEFAVQLSKAVDRSSISPRSSHQHPKSQSGALFSRLSSTIHRPGIERQSVGVSNARFRICDHWHNLVPGPCVVCVRFKRTIANERSDRAMAQSNSRRAICFSRSPSRHCEVTISILGLELGSTLEQAHAKLDKLSDPAHLPKEEEEGPERKILWQLARTDYSAVFVKSDERKRITYINAFLRPGKEIPFEKIGDTKKAPLQDVNTIVWDVLRPKRPLSRVVAKGADRKANNITIFVVKRPDLEHAED